METKSMAVSQQDPKGKSPAGAPRGSTISVPEIQAYVQQGNVYNFNNEL